MALKKDQNYLPHVKRNAGIGNPDQLQFTARTSAPSDSDLANGRVYYDSTDLRFYGYISSAWFPFGTGSKATVTNITTSTTLTAAQSGNLIVCASTGGSLIVTLPSAATGGLTYYIVNSSADAATGDLRLAPATNQWIAGATGNYRALDTQYDAIILVADGSTQFLKVGQSIT